MLFRISIRTLSWKPNCQPMHGPWGCVRIMTLGGYTDRCGKVVTSLVVCFGHSQCITDMLYAYRTQTRLKLLVRRWSGRFNQRFPKLWSARNLWAGCWKRSVFEHPYCQSTDQETLKKQYKDEAWQHCCRAKSRRVTECPWTESRHFDRYRLDGIRKEDC